MGPVKCVANHRLIGPWRWISRLAKHPSSSWPQSIYQARERVWQLNHNQSHPFNRPMSKFPQFLALLALATFGSHSLPLEDNSAKNQSQSVQNGIETAANKIDEASPGDGPCEFSQRKIPGLKIVNIDGNGRKCQGEIQVPFCRGLCKTIESGTHIFPYRDQESYFCGLVEEKGTRNVTLEECEEGVEESARFVEVSSATQCQCQKMP